VAVFTAALDLAKVNTGTYVRHDNRLVFVV